jgi:predicted Fe-Mo cluster-binding NifX family protein
VEPYQKSVQRIAIALDDRNGMVSRGFGSAPFFAFSDMHVVEGTEAQRTVTVNPHRDDDAQQGLNVARWLLGEGVDVVITGESISDKAPGYLLLDAGVRTMALDIPDLESALAGWRENIREDPPAAGPAEDSGFSGNPDR